MLEEETLNAATVPTLSHPGLLVMDVDSTLIDEEVIDCLLYTSPSPRDCS